ncbi:AMP-binding protein [Streptomyces sp. Qhu-G9]|uniref:AMP-binding protein n=1 Tax=Streptomyces sp. Qhu-G9 TaxID=3452799 RepID=UPI0022AC6278|nr:AMP-binding protein [Streptomyces aurantiacus]
MLVVAVSLHPDPVGESVACLRAGIAPVMALPAHRGHELRYLAAHAEVTAIAVPDRLGDFDHQALGREVAAATPSVRLLLVVGGTGGTGGRGGTVGIDATDLRGLAEPADDPAAARARLDRVAPESGDIAVFLLSGGTTGLPKLITRTHDDYEYNARRSAEVCGLDSDDVYLVSLPAGHNFPLACPGILGTLMNGGRVVLARTPDPDKVLPLMAEGVTVTAAVPAVVQRWIDAVASGHHSAPPTLQLLQVGGARLAPEVARRAEPVLGGTLQQVFGMAEGLLNYTRLEDPDDRRIETQGRPMCPDDEILVVDASDNPVPPRQHGRPPHPRPVHPARLLPGRRAQRPRVHPRPRRRSRTSSTACRVSPESPLSRSTIRIWENGSARSWSSNRAPT